jgi:predicted GNAT superfamily acetyltransferase
MAPMAASSRDASLHDSAEPARTTEGGAEHDTRMAVPGSGKPTSLPPAESPLVGKAAAARAAADAAALASGVVVRNAVDHEELRGVCDLFRKIWDEDPEDPALTPLILQALEFAGNYVSVAEADGRLVGACVGFFGLTEDGWELHSHIAGVTSRLRGRHIGFALKTHQRAWAVGRGVNLIRWTFDPLIRRNAIFNLSKLAVRPHRYLPNFYGPMTDGINAGDETDRLLVDWHLLDPAVAQACTGRPRTSDLDDLREAGAAVGLSPDANGAPVLGDVDASTVLVAIPEDIERLRTVDPSRAMAWRLAIRDLLGELMNEGAVITGFVRSGWYIVEREVQ